jgi:AcrR family transcriptional regulator
VSSAVYRYFASRDELLTALIIDAYNSLGAAAEATAATTRRDARARWLALGRGIRHWALDHRHEYALLYGSPVPGYAAPADTIEPANRPVIVFLDLLRDAAERGAVEVPADRLPRAIRSDMTEGFGAFGYDLPPAVLARAVTAWAQLFGALNFELFGRLTNFIHDYEAWFEVQLEGMAGYLGL